MKHGAREPFYGVKVQDLKKIVKKIKRIITYLLSFMQQDGLPYLV